MRAAKILIAEDEAEVARLVELTLQNNQEYQFLVRISASGKEALEIARSWKPDLILLDLGLPDLHGYELLRVLHREQPLCKFCIMSVASTVSDKVTSFESGTDDYIVKPFSAAELVARVKALLRREKIINDSNIIHADICLNTTNETFTRAGKVIQLSRREFSLLHYLMQRPGEVISRNELLEKVWQGKDCFPNVVDAHIESLRKKIDISSSHKLIRTSYKRGYFYQVPTL